MRHIALFISVIRRICDLSQSVVKGVPADNVFYGQSELDSHDDTIALGHNSTIMG